MISAFHNIGPGLTITIYINIFAFSIPELLLVLLGTNAINAASPERAESLFTNHDVLQTRSANLRAKTHPYAGRAGPAT
jgi:hypothetical protein